MNTIHLRVTALRAVAILTLAGCSSNLGKLGIIDDGDDAGVDAGRRVEDASADATADAPVDLVDASPDVIDVGPTRGSPDGGRAVASACGDAGRPAGQRQDAGGCQADLECDAGSDGRCNFARFADGGTANVCTYDACYVDATCSGTGACGCGVGSKAQNLCLSNSNCRIDSDCGSGERCVYSDPIILRARLDDAVNQGNEVGGTNYNGQALGYFCTTPQDACFATTRPDGGIASACTYNIDKKTWEWSLGP